MSDPSGDRLQQFRAQYGQARPRASVLAVLNLVVMVAGFAAVILFVRTSAGNASATAAPAHDPDTQRAFALYLSEKNQPLAAISAYEDYLETAALPAEERASICYAVAKLAIEAEQYERALPFLYQAEFVKPDSDLKDEISKKIVLCLDKLGRNVDLRHELRKRTTVKRTAKDLEPGEVILAEFAGEVITTRDLELEIEKMPPAVRDSVDTPDKKAELVKNMVVQRLLLDKARRLELDKDEEIQQQLAHQLDAMIVNKLLEDEIRSGINLTPEDVERFYKAEPELFTEPATASVLMAAADTEEAARSAEFPEKPVTVRKGGRVPEAPASLDATEDIFATEPGNMTKPSEADDKWYVFKVVSKTEDKLLPFEEVKDQATRMFQSQKERERFNELLEQTLSAENVQLHLDQLKEPEQTQ